MLSQADRATGVLWAYQPAPSIREIAAGDGSILVVPLGSIEQHGNHLAVATDSLLAQSVAETAAAAISDEVDVLVSPTVWTGYSPHHLSIGGTLTAPFPVCLQHLQSVIEAGVKNGFDSVLIVNGHGGNRALVGAATSELGRRDSKREYLGLTYFDLATDIVAKVRDSELGGMAHGGEFETSLMLHLYPELVASEADAAYFDEPYEHGDTDLVEPGPLSVYRPFEAYSDSGAIGDPEKATEEKGRILFEFLTEELSRLLSQISTKTAD